MTRAIMLLVALVVTSMVPGDSARVSLKGTLLVVGLVARRLFRSALGLTMTASSTADVTW